MSGANETFFTTVGCMDGRVWEPAVKFGREKFETKFADTITEAGLVGVLAEESVNPELLRSLKFKIVDVSLQKHHSNGIIVHGHQDCAGNPVSDEQHKKDILKSAEVIRSLIPNSVPVVPVFAKRDERGKWIVEELPAIIAP